MSRIIKALFVGTVLITVSAIPCFADLVQSVQTITAGGITFTANLAADTTTHQYTLIFSGLNTSSTSSATLNTFALQIFGVGSDADFLLGSTTNVTNWSFFAGNKINNSGSLGCPTSSPGTAGWLCGTANSALDAYLLGPSGSFTWTFTGTFANTAVPLEIFHIQANGLYGITSSNTGQKWAISAAMPEPGSMLLLGAGLLSTAFLRRRK